jgi:hypothetical protein
MAVVMQTVKRKLRVVSKTLVNSSEKLIVMEGPEIDVMVGGILALMACVKLLAQKVAPVRKAALIADQRVQSPAADKIHLFQSRIPDPHRHLVAAGIDRSRSRTHLRQC